jgi:chloride channel protein, CIC family
VTPLYADTVAEAAIDFAIGKQSDVIILGASRESLLQQTVRGNIPEAIARQSQCTVIVVRKAIAD